MRILQTRCADHVPCVLIVYDVGFCKRWKIAMHA